MCRPENVFLQLLPAPSHDQAATSKGIQKPSEVLSLSWFAILRSTLRIIRNLTFKVRELTLSDAVLWNFLFSLHVFLLTFLLLITRAGNRSHRKCDVTELSNRQLERVQFKRPSWVARVETTPSISFLSPHVTSIWLTLAYARLSARSEVSRQRDVRPRLPRPLQESPHTHARVSSTF